MCLEGSEKENEKNVNPFSRAQFDFHISLFFIAVDFLQLRAHGLNIGERIEWGGVELGRRGIMKLN